MPDQTAANQYLFEDQPAAGKHVPFPIFGSDTVAPRTAAAAANAIRRAKYFFGSETLAPRTTEETQIKLADIAVSAAPTTLYTDAIITPLGNRVQSMLDLPIRVFDILNSSNVPHSLKKMVPMFKKIVGVSVFNAAFAALGSDSAETREAAANVLINALNKNHSRQMSENSVTNGLYTDFAETQRNLEYESLVAATEACQNFYAQERSKTDLRTRSQQNTFESILLQLLSDFGQPTKMELSMLPTPTNAKHTPKELVKKDASTIQKTLQANVLIRPKF